MKRKRKDSSEEFWPVEGIDYPYPEEVQKALDLVEAETTRIKRAECAHRFDNYIPMLNDDGRTIAKVWRCDKCGMTRRGEAVTGRMRTPAYGFAYERPSTALPIMITASSSDLGGVLMVNAEGSFTSSLAAEIAEDMEEMERDMREMQREMEEDMREMRRDMYRDARELARDMERMRPRAEGQLRRSISVSSEELDWERVKARNRARQAARMRLPSVISDPDDMSWIKTTNKR